MTGCFMRVKWLHFASLTLKTEHEAVISEEWCEFLCLFIQNLATASLTKFHRKYIQSVPSARSVSQKVSVFKRKYTVYKEEYRIYVKYTLNSGLMSETVWCIHAYINVGMWLYVFFLQFYLISDVKGKELILIKQIYLLEIQVSI